MTNRFGSLGLILLMVTVGIVIGGWIGVLLSRRWKPGDDEWMKALRLIGGVAGALLAGGAISALGGFGTRVTVENGLSNVELFRVLKQDYPQDYAAVVARTTQIVDAGGTPADAGRDLRPQVQALLKRQLPRASDASLAALLAVSSTELQETRGSSPASCIALMDGMLTSPSKLFSATTLQQELALEAVMLRQTAERPVTTRPALPASALAPVYAKALSSLGPFEEAMARNVGQRGGRTGSKLEQQAFCHFGMALFNQIRRVEQPRQAQLLLTLLRQR